MKINGKTLTILLCCILLISCRQHRHEASVTPVEDSVRTEKPTTPVLVPATIASMQCDWFSTRINLSVNNIKPEKELVSLTAFVVNKKDSAIFITLNKLGIEIARLLLTKDSVKYANHLSHEYYWGQYSWLKKQIGMDINFFTVQALLLAQDIPDFEPVFTANVSNDSIIYTAAHRNNTAHTMILEERIITDTAHHMLYHYIKDIASVNTISVQYNRYTLIDGFTCYQTIIIDIPNENLKIEGLLKNTKFNTAGPTTSRMPVKYKPINTTH